MANDLVKALKGAKQCLVKGDLACAEAQYREASKLVKCHVCQEQIRVFIGELDKLPKKAKVSKNTIKKANLLIKVAKPSGKVHDTYTEIKLLKAEAK